MKVVIAGCGWLGIALGKQLLEHGYSVVGIRRRSAAAELLSAAGIEPLIVDLDDPAALPALPCDATAIVACQSADGRSDDAYRRAYVERNATLLRYARKARLTRFVYTGSTGVFSGPDGATVDEATRPAAATTRSRILRDAEQAVLDAGSGTLRSCVVRLSGLYGPQRYGVIERVREGRLALGPGEERWMNFCHRADAARVVTAALQRGRAGAVYHGSDDEPTRRADVVRWIATRLGIAAPRARRGAAQATPDPGRRVRSTRTREELAIRLLYPSFRDGLSEVLPDEPGRA